jgi:2'-5' RNA ligase
MVEMAPGTARLFVALWLPDSVAGHLAAALDGLAASTPGQATVPDPGSSGAPVADQLRRTRTQTWHLTVAFLGQVPRARALSDFDGLAREPLPQAGRIALRGSGTFGNTAWIGVSHGRWLDELAEVVQGRLHVADRRFRAHVTVARARRGPQPESVVARGFAAQLAEYSGPDWQPCELLLVESQLGPRPSYPVRQRLPIS